MAVTVNGGAPSAPQIAEFQSVFQVAPAGHVASGGAAHANAVAAGAAGFMTGADKTKLDGIATAATANSADATLLARANHTGTQAASTISDFNSATRAQTEAELIAGTGITITPGSSGATRTLTLASTGGAGVTDGDKGDITVSGSGATWTVDNGLAATKIADGTVTNAEFQYLGGVTSDIQTQLDAKLDADIATDITATKAAPIGADQIILLDSADSDTPKLATITSLPAGAPADGSITLAKLANLAQDQFIGRTTASTGVPQTATITAAARTVLDDATVGDMRTTLSAAARAQTGMIPFFIRTVADETLRLVVNVPVALTITNITTRSASGTCTVTGQIDGTPLGGTANSASSTEQSQAHASANAMSAGSDFLLAFSSNSACLGLAVNVHYTYNQA